MRNQTPPDTAADRAPDRAPDRASVSVADLVRDGLVRADHSAALDPIAAQFRIRLTPDMRAAIAADPATDPVAAQFVPDPREALIRPEELTDPIGDHAHSPVPGLTHRYPDRVIVHVTQSCEVYCRFCFRRETVGSDGPLPAQDLDAVMAYLAATPDIFEVILTGGDPLSLSARRIGDILARLADIPHIGAVRFHTRVPVVAPGRITPALIAALRVRPAVSMVIHTNHARELTAAACAALARLADAGVPLMSQTVLLCGVNADADTLADLFRMLVRNRVKPYYLHHCDLARGTGHFRTTIAEGQAIMAALRGRISGLAMPTYVLDIPGGFGKVPIGPGYLTQDADGSWQVRDPQGGLHRYDDPA